MREKSRAAAWIKKISRGVQLLLEFFLSSVRSFLEKNGRPRNSFPKDLNSMFIFKQLHNFHLGLYKILRNCFGNSYPIGRSWQDEDEKSAPASCFHMKNCIFAGMQSFIRIYGKLLTSNQAACGLFNKWGMFKI